MDRIDLREQGCYKRIEEYMGRRTLRTVGGKFTSEIHKSKKDSDHMVEKEK